MATPTTPSAGQHPYAAFLRRVTKPAQYVGGEFGQVRKPWDQVAARVCLAFPDLYEVGMSHLGYKILYGKLNEQDDLLAERAYAVAADMEDALRNHGEPLRSLESARPLRDFDVVGFSLQYELTYTNVLCMLDLGGIPLRSAERGEDDPLVIAGGPVATHAEPLAPFIDAFAIGDGEELAAAMARSFAASRAAGLSRTDALRALAHLDGVYVPSLYTTRRDEDTGLEVVAGPIHPDVPMPVRRAFVADIDSHPFPSGGPVAATETVFDRVSVEIARGCTEGCRFCQAGMIYRPVRERSPDSILRTLDDAVRTGGYDEVSLSSLSTADYSAISPLLRRVVERHTPDRVSVTVSSLRAYGLTEEVLDEMTKSKATGLTFAPEAGSQRMRDVINKNVTEEALMETANRVFSRGWTRMKLYFMIGLPTETDEDVIAIVETGVRAYAVGRRAQGKRGPRVTVSVSTFVPKPHTPFQWCAMDDHATVLRKQDLLRQAAKGRGIGLRMHVSFISYLEGVMARGDRSLAPIIERAYRLGARFDSWKEHLRADVWRQVFEEAAIDPETFLGRLPPSGRLPWDHIDVGLAQGFLAREHRRALKERLSPPCGKPLGAQVHPTNLRAAAQANAKKLICYHCGVACDLEQMKTERVGFLTSLGATGEAKTSPATATTEPVATEGRPNVATEGRPDTASSDRASSDRAPTNEEPRGTVGRAPADQDAETLDEGTAADVTPAVRKPLRIRPQDRRPNVKPQGPRLVLRLAFRKLGRLAYSGHLDLMRSFLRLLRRADLPLYHTQGFSPHPELTFTPALPVGTTSLVEHVDVVLRADLVGDLPNRVRALPARLNATSIEGLTITDARLLAPGDRRISQIVDRTSYSVGLPRPFLAERGLEREEDLRAHLAEREQHPLVATRLSKGKLVTIDVSRALVGTAAGPGGDALAEAGVIGDLLPMTLTLRTVTGKTPRPAEVLSALFAPLAGASGEGATAAAAVEVPAAVVRSAVVSAAGHGPLDLESLRAERATTGAEPSAVHHRAPAPAPGNPKGDHAKTASVSNAGGGGDATDGALA